jgi:hypothetical protein
MCLSNWRKMEIPKKMGIMAVWSKKWMRMSIQGPLGSRECQVELGKKSKPAVQETSLSDWLTSIAWPGGSSEAYECSRTE